jgi:hypothetical protein
LAASSGGSAKESCAGQKTKRQLCCGAWHGVRRSGVGVDVANSRRISNAQTWRVLTVSNALRGGASLFYDVSAAAKMP